MFRSWRLNNKINRIRERALRIVHNDTSSSFQELLDKYNFVTIHLTNIRNLSTETNKFLQGLSQPGLNEVFVERDCNYNLWSNNFLNRRRINSVRYGNESVLFLAPKCILSNGFSIVSKAKSKNGLHGKALVDVDFVKHTYRKKDLSERRKSKNTYHWISWRQLAFKSLWKCYCNSLVNI